MRQITEFENAPLMQKRILIAMDVLAAIDADTYRPLQGDYITYTVFNHFVYTESVQDILINDRIKGCKVCALGACFLSLIKFENQLTIGELTSLTTCHFANNENNPVGRDRLRKYFGEEQLTLIEAAFEHYGGYSNDIADKDLLRKAEIFYITVNGGMEMTRNEILNMKIIGKHDTSADTQVLKAIMQNIIDNGGEFIP